METAREPVRRGGHSPNSPRKARQGLRRPAWMDRSRARDPGLTEVFWQTVRPEKQGGPILTLAAPSHRRVSRLRLQIAGAGRTDNSQLLSRWEDFTTENVDLTWSLLLHGLTQLSGHLLPVLSGYLWGPLCGSVGQEHKL